MKTYEIELNKSRVHLAPADSKFTACGRYMPMSYLAITKSYTDVTCKNCLRVIGAREGAVERSSISS